jgi:Putative auto-transporter adhesin, head GIN domain
MKRTLLVLTASFLAFGIACKTKRMKGNGNIVTENRTVSNARKIKLSDNFDVTLVPGNTTQIAIVADENLIPYIETTYEDNFLVIKENKHTNLVASENISIQITTPTLEAVSITGTGNVVGKGKFSGADQLKLSIAGSGDITLAVNTPKIIASIAGSGNITVTGETKDNEIHISGSGDYHSDGLKAENGEVHIAGNGDVTIFADQKLDIHIAGQGDVSYKGSPKISKKIAGNGEIKPLVE